MLSIPALTHHRWALPVLAELHERNGSRFVPLQNRLGISRDVLRQTLDALDELGFVMRNPGYGHPSRPEYVLAQGGQTIAPACAELLAALRRLGVEDVGLKKWTLPVLAALDGERRFGELARAAGASPRALSLALKDLVGAGLVERRVLDGYPPSSSYLASATGRVLQASVCNLLADLQHYCVAQS